MPFEPREKWICRACAEKRWPGREAEELTIGKLVPTPCNDCGEPTMSTILAPKED